MENKQILEKIKKLLSLATSSNENEAKTASAMASKLMTKYNLNMQQVSFKSAEYIEENVFEGKRRKVEQKFITSILSKYFNIETISSSRRNTGVKIVLIGDKANVEVATYTFSFLEDAFKKLFNQYRKETGAPASARQPYYMGLYNGFCAKMEEAKVEAEQEYGLVVVPDAGLTRFFKQKYPRCKNRKSKVRTGDVSAQTAGNAAGRDLNVNRGISHSNSAGSVKLLR